MFKRESLVGKKWLPLIKEKEDVEKPFCDSSATGRARQS